MNPEGKDVRWHQRFVSFNKAFDNLARFKAVKELNELEKQGLIKAFEITWELSWNTLQDLLKEKGYQGVVGPKPVIEQSFKDGYILDGEAWMCMHISRNLTSHIYNQETADEIVGKIKAEYFDLFLKLKEKLEEERYGRQSKLFGAGR
jgi:nucleotidyltransferase substrate binding protein (TIGR01987 family)